jgi:hypothetical protein
VSPFLVAFLEMAARELTLGTIRMMYGKSRVSKAVRKAVTKNPESVRTRPI